LSANDYVGRMAIGRVWNGRIKFGQKIVIVREEEETADGTIEPGRTISLTGTVTSLTTAHGIERVDIEEAGPGDITHIWVTLSSHEPLYLKKLVLRMYWDNEIQPSVEAPIGDFFGLGLGAYHSWHSQMLSVGSEKSLNSFFPMPFGHHARITVTNEGKQPIGDLYYNIDYRTYAHPLAAGTLYFHAQYHQAQPNHGWTNNWTRNQDALVDKKPNFTGDDNYVWMEAKGHGQFVGVTMSVLQNQDSWWGEGDDMFFIDGEKTPSIAGTGAEDYFLGAWDFGGHPFSYPLYGAPIVGDELAGARTRYDEVKQLDETLFAKDFESL